MSQAVLLALGALIGLIPSLIAIYVQFRLSRQQFLWDRKFSTLQTYSLAGYESCRRISQAISDCEYIYKHVKEGTAKDVDESMERLSADIEQLKSNLNSQAVLVNVLFNHKIRRLTATRSALPSSTATEEGNNYGKRIDAVFIKLRSALKQIEDELNANLDAISKELQ